MSGIAVDVVIMTLKLSLFGSFQASMDARPLIHFRSDKIRALLVFLIIESNRPHRRERLATLLWPRASSKGARQNLRLSFFRLRQAIDQVAGYALSQQLFSSSNQSIQANVSDGADLVWSDVAEFQAQIGMCESCEAANFFACVPCLAQLMQGVDLYQGELLPGFYVENAEPFEEWLLLTRERYHQQAVAALESLIAIYQKRDKYELVCDYTRRLLALEPWRELAHRQLMLALARSGERGAALAQFAKCRQILQKELRVEPGMETIQVYEAIKTGGDRAAPASGARQNVSTNGYYHNGSSRTNLPALVTSFWGRERERDELAQMAANPAFRLTTLVGEGGVGKTRLALETAVHIQTHFRDGVWFVELVDVAPGANRPRTEDAIITAIAAALDLKLNPGQPLKAQLFALLKDRRLLLTLDNFEHLLDYAPLLVEILHRAPQVSILCTSREPLHLMAEYVYPVAGLPLPDGADELPTAREMPPLENFACVSLFADRVRRAGTGYEVTAVNLPQIIQVCQLVAGNPLGIELAAAAMRRHSLAHILESDLSALDRLSTRRRDVPARHQSMRAVIAGSWEALPAHERQILARLSVFRGGFTAEAAQITAGASRADLERLRVKSLAHKTAENRYVLHGLLRQFAQERLETAVAANGAHYPAAVQERRILPFSI